MASRENTSSSIPESSAAHLPRKRPRESLVVSYDEAKDYAFTALNEVVAHLEKEAKIKDLKILELRKYLEETKEINTTKLAENARLRAKLHEVMSWHEKEMLGTIKRMTKESQIELLEKQIMMAEEAKGMGFNIPWDIESLEFKLRVTKNYKSQVGPSRLGQTK